MDICCKNCKDRYVGCHDRCDKYLNWKKEHEKEKEKIRKMHYNNRIARK